MLRKLLCGIAALVLVVISGFLLFAEDEVSTSPMDISADAGAPASFMPTREHEGVTYEALSTGSLTTVLLIGYDHMDDGALIDERDGFNKGGQSDFLLLLAIDHDKQQIRQLQFDRDTMTDVKFYSKFGANYGTRRMQICLSHAYGDTQELNNSNAIWAVENFLGIAGENDGAQVDMYLSMDITGIGRLNDLLGGVTVPINDDFSHYDPTMKLGTTMKLTGEQAHIYCRQRYYIGDQSNKSRMARQRVYMDAATELLKAQLDKNPTFANELLSGLGIIYDTSSSLDENFGFTIDDQKGTPITDTPTHYLMTNHSLDAIVALLVRVLHYEILPVESIPGYHQVGISGYMEFIADEGAGIQWALDALYRPLN